MEGSKSLKSKTASLSRTIKSRVDTLLHHGYDKDIVLIAH